MVLCVLWQATFFLARNATASMSASLECLACAIIPLPGATKPIGKRERLRDGGDTARKVGRDSAFKSVHKEG